MEPRQLLTSYSSIIAHNVYRCMLVLRISLLIFSTGVPPGSNTLHGVCQAHLKNVTASYISEMKNILLSILSNHQRLSNYLYRIEKEKAG